MYFHNGCCDKIPGEWQSRAIHVFILAVENLAKGLVSGVFKLGQRLNLQRRFEERKALRELSELDDAALKDIGVSRDDLYWASRLPSSVSPTVELEIRVRGGNRIKR